MPYVTIAKFNGIDTRRDVLASVPGALVTAENGHINQGGEFESRKGFFLNGTATNFTGTFGLTSTENGLEVYGSDAAPATAMPSGFVYVRLQHPAVLDGETYDAAKHAMTAVPFSTPYEGKAFVCALFADGLRFLYFDGNLVEQSRNGYVLDLENTAADQAVRLAAMINDVIDGWTATVSGSTVTVITPPSIHFEPTITVDSSLGTLTTQQIGVDFAGTPGNRARAVFEVVWGASGSITIAVSENPASGAFDNMGLLVNVSAGEGTDSASLALAIVNKINASGVLQPGSVFPGWTASADDVVVTVFAPLSLGAFTGSLWCTYDGTIVVQDPTTPPTPPPLSMASASPTSFVVAKKSEGNPGPCVVGVTGGSGNYTYAWTKLSGDSRFSATNPTGPSTSFAFDGDPGAATTLVASFACVVTDQTSSIQVTSNTVIVKARR